MTKPRTPLPLPPMVFRDVRFEVVHVDEEPCLRADQIGRALALEPPEPKVLELYQAHRGHFSDFITRVVPVTVEAGPRPMRVFTLWGTLSLAKRATTAEAPDFEAWIVECMMIRGYSMHWEVIRLHGENADLWGRLNETEARYRLVSMQIEELKANGRPGGPSEPLDGDYRRLREEQAQQAALLRNLVGQVSAFLEELPAELLLSLEDARLTRPEGLPGLLEAGLKPLAEAVARLDARFQAVKPVRRDAERAAREAGRREPVAALAVPEFHFMGFDYRDGETLRALIYRDRPAPWFPAEDLGRLAGLPEFTGEGLAAEVERLVPAPHRDYATGDRSLPIVDPVGLDALLWAWGRPLGEMSGGGDLWDWIAGTVMPSIHAVMLREAQLDPAGAAHPGFPRAPTEVVAEGPFEVYAGELDGRPCRVVNGRGLHKFLGAGWRQFGDWWRDKVQWANWREGRDFQRVFVHAGRYDPYLSLDAALTLLLTEKSPRKAEAEAFLMKVARGQPAVIEGEAVRVEEGAPPSNGKLMPVTFNETTLFLLNHDGEPYVPMKPVVEGMGLNWDSQLDKLRGNEARWGIAKIAIPSAGGLQEMVCLPLRRFFGWGMSIHPNKVNPEIRETIITYQQKCDEVLWQYWFARAQGSAHVLDQPAPAVVVLPDTPPRDPRVFEYRDGKGRPIPVRVAVRGGLGWAAAPGVALGLAESLAALEKACAQIPRSWIGSMPAPSGESVDLALSEQALGYLFGQRAHRGEAMDFRDWWFLEVEPALRSGGVRRVEVAAEPAAGEPPPPGPGPAGEAREAMAADSLRGGFEALALRCWRKQGRKTHAAFPACAAVLALLWEEAREGEWIPTGTRGGFARRIGMSSGTGVQNALGRLRDWDLVEFRPEGDGWPEAIRLHPENLAAVLREAGLELPDGEAGEGGRP